MSKKSAKNLLLFLSFLICFLITGCGKEKETYGGTYYIPPSGFVTDLKVKLSSSDKIYMNVFNNEFQERLYRRSGHHDIVYKDTDSALCKRRMAFFELGLIPYSYKFLNYQEDGSLSGNFLVAMRLDAVSNFGYNLVSLCRIPNRLIISPRVSTGLLDWFGNIAIIMWDLFLSLVMLFLGPIIGFVCHPWESLSNLIAGILYIPPDGFEQYWKYLKNTNLIMSIWDLLKCLWIILLRTVFFWI